MTSSTAGAPAVVQRQPQANNNSSSGGGGSSSCHGNDDPCAAGFRGCPGRQPLLTQPMARPPPPPPTGRRELRPWSTGLFGCLEDTESCLCVAACGPCYACCELAPRLGESPCAPLCLSLGRQSIAMVLRTKLRTAQGIRGDAIEDCLMATLCPACVLCQVKREIDYVERCTGAPAFVD